MTEDSQRQLDAIVSKPLLLHGDCLQLMKDIPDGSVDMVCCDMPYGTTNCRWDTTLDLQRLWEQYRRVTKENAAIVLTFPSDKQRIALHPTQKPLALIEWLIATYTNEGDTVLDNCMGSGTAGEACVKLGREFVGIELDQGYFETAQDRIKALGR